ncbi:MAG: hypothetical protein IJE47_04400 [Bacteroidales bacterium]|nr:hypothetical protein [Bacteroidales bacterium]
MKKVLVTLSLVIVLGLGANAQYFDNTQTTDGFFSTSAPGGNYRNGTAGEELPGLPGFELYQDQGAPLGSGLLILAGMGLAYGLKRREK